MRIRLAALAAATLGLTAAFVTAGGTSAQGAQSASHAQAAATPAAKQAAAAAAAPPDWPMYHGSLNRAGNYTGMPTASGTPFSIANVPLDGKVYASPIIVGGMVVVATENDSVYGLTTSGTIRWHRKLGAPARLSQLPCGNIDPSGITGTPAYSSSTGLLYLVVEHGAPVRHAVAAINIHTGGVAWTRQLTLPGTAQNAMQERGAINLGNHRIWITFGGRAGDCGSYKGTLIGLPLAGAGTAVVYTVPTAREAGAWTPPGPTVDINRKVYVAVGNGASGVGDPYDGSDSVMEFDGNAHLISRFSPSTWATDNDADRDLGSQGPALVGKWVFQAGKSGTAYVLKRDALGGIGHQVSSASLCQSFGGTAVSGNVVYVPCTDGMRRVAISDSGTMTTTWHAASGITGSPVIGGGRVWALDTGAGVLYGLSPSNGADAGHVTVPGGVTRFAAPALYGGRVFVPTLTGLSIFATSCGGALVVC